MNLDLFYAFTIAFVGATLFLLVDKHEPDGPVARLLKFLVLFVASVATWVSGVGDNDTSVEHLRS